MDLYLEYKSIYNGNGVSPKLANSIFFGKRPDLLLEITR